MYVNSIEIARSNVQISSFFSSKKNYSIKRDMKVKEVTPKNVTIKE